MLSISSTSPSKKNGTSLIYCNACISSSTSVSSGVSKWARDRKPGGNRRVSGENLDLVHWSSGKVVWLAMRLDPVKIEEFRSCLPDAVRVSRSHLTGLFSGFALPEYGAFDTRGYMNAPRLANGEELPHSPHVELDLGCHAQTSLNRWGKKIYVNPVQLLGWKGAGLLATSTPVSNRMAPMVDSDTASRGYSILSRIRLIACPL